MRSEDVLARPFGAPVARPGHDSSAHALPRVAISGYSIVGDQGVLVALLPQPSCRLHQQLRYCGVDANEHEHRRAGIRKRHTRRRAAHDVEVVLRRV